LVWLVKSYSYACNPSQPRQHRTPRSPPGPSPPFACFTASEFSPEDMSLLQVPPLSFFAIFPRLTCQNPKELPPVTTLSAPLVPFPATHLHTIPPPTPPNLEMDSLTLLRRPGVFLSLALWCRPFSPVADHFFSRTPHLAPPGLRQGRFSAPFGSQMSKIFLRPLPHGTVSPASVFPSVPYIPSCPRLLTEMLFRLPCKIPGPTALSTAGPSAFVQH